jgi:hypothetical protein
VTQKSSAKLAAALREIGLETLAQDAEKDFYHDFSSPYPLPEMVLVRELQIESTKCGSDQNDKRIKIMALRRRVIDGEFDATIEESDAWAASPEGQEAFSRLVRGKTDPKT